MMDSDFDDIYGEITKALMNDVDLIIAEDLKQTREAFQIAKVAKREAPLMPLYLSFNLQSANEIKNGDNLQQVINTLEYFLKKPVTGYGLSGKTENVLKAAASLESERPLILQIGQEGVNQIKKDELSERVKMVGICQKSSPGLVKELRSKL